uniref:Microseminoprotein, prostate associated n=1 Tax=Mastacembelus armatus TaxID=205130 RepID=A0A7N8YML0_9TELE
MPLQVFFCGLVVALLHPWSVTSTLEVRPPCFKVSLTLALCVFEGRHYSLGETWMDNACMQCTLHASRVHRPVDFPAWCEVRVEPVTCKVSLVQTADPRLPCSPGDDIQDPSHGSFHLQQQLEG